MDENTRMDYKFEDYDMDEFEEMSTLDKIKAKVKGVKDWSKEHKAVILLVGLATAKAIGKNRAKKLRAIEATKEHYYVDPVDQHTYDLKHEMSSDERDYFYIKRIQGEVTGQTTEDILREMNILK